MRKAPPKKRVTRSVWPRKPVEPARMALAALERIRSVLVGAGRERRLGDPLDEGELSAQAAFIGTLLPSSYAATMRVASQIGDPETFLVAATMRAEGDRIARFGGEASKRYAPFAKDAEHVFCFDKGSDPSDPLTTTRPDAASFELPIVAWRDGSASPAAAHFGEWLDAVADVREEAYAKAAEIPSRLKQLLYDLGFRFEAPLVGRLETGDRAAMTGLIGDELAARVLGDAERLFDSSGKASLILNVDEFSIAVSLRTGIYVIEAEDVFRWLRTFRDENFFFDTGADSVRADAVRDLRRAPPEPPLVQRGMLTLPKKPSRSLVFRAASGTSAEDVHLLARTASTSERGPSTILHLAGGRIATSHRVEIALNDIHVAPDGTIWGLSATHAVRIADGRTQSYRLAAPPEARPWWYGIGGYGERVIVWGRGALLAFNGHGFEPFAPDAMLDDTESAVALSTRDRRIWMLVCGERMGAVAHFDGATWLPITESQVIVGMLADLDVRRDVAYVVDRDGNVWKVAPKAPPSPIALLTYHQAYVTEVGSPRPILGVRAWAGGLLFASNGGVISVGGSEPLFHAISEGRDPVRLVRLEDPTRPAADDAAILALGGSSVCIWQDGGFSVLDLSDA